MFKRFFTLFQQDLKVAVRNYFHIVVLVMAVLMIVVLNFIIPEKVKLTPTELFYDASQGQVLKNFLLEQGADPERFFDSREDLEEEIKNNDKAIGIIMEGDLENARFTTLYQGTESEEILNVLDASLEGTLDKIRNTTREAGYRVEYLRPKAEPVPFNKSMIPVMIVTDAVMLGFLLVAVMVFQEKEEGSVRAYRVSPGGTLEYILSKSAVNVLLAVIYSLLVFVFTAGFDINYPALILMTVLASLLMTLVGLTASVFFKTLQEFLFPAIFILFIAGIPIVSYMSPSFAPGFITWLPSYPVLFGMREILFPTGKGWFVSSLNWILAAECVAFFIISYWAIHKKLMKEGK